MNNEEFFCKNNKTEKVSLRFGRKPAFTLCCFILASVVTGSAFSPNLITFCILRFISGACNVGLFDLYFVWGNFVNV